MLDKEEIPISSSHFPSSTFINLNNCSDEDVSLPMSFDVNVCGSFLPLVSKVSTLEGVLLNLNQVQGWSFKIIINCLKAMFVTPHSSNELRYLDYIRLMFKMFFVFPSHFNIIFEFLPICFPTGHSGQMQAMDHKYWWWCLVQTEYLQHEKQFQFGI